MAVSNGLLALVKTSSGNQVVYLVLVFHRTLLSVELRVRDVDSSRDVSLPIMLLAFELILGPHIHNLNVIS